MRIFSIIFLLISLALTACQPSEKNTIKLGVIAGPEAELAQVAKKVAKDKYGLNIKIVEFTDYNIPNVALNDGSIDANLFQHQPFLDETIQKAHFKLVSIGKVFVYPMGAYSKKIKSISELPEGAIVAIPSDPTNQTRALNLLEAANFIQLKPAVGAFPTTQDLVKNYKKLVFKPMDAALLTRILPDVDLAIINSTFAIPAGLLPNKDALLIESPNSPYANIIVVREADKDKPQLKQLVEAFHSQEVKDAAKKLFQGQAIPAW